MVEAKKDPKKNEKDSKDDKKKKDKEEKVEPVDTRTPDQVTMDMIRDHAKLLDRCVNTREPRFAVRVTRAFASSLRKRVTPSVLASVSSEFAASLDCALPNAVPNACATKNSSGSELTAMLPAGTVVVPTFVPPTPVAAEETAMEVDKPAGDTQANAKDADEKKDTPGKDDSRPVSASGVQVSKKADSTSSVAAVNLATCTLPELSVYAHMLYTVWFLDQKDTEKSLLCANKLFALLAANNRRSLDPLAARAYYFCYLVFENWATKNPTEGAEALRGLRSFLHARFRTAVLHQDIECQATLLNLLLRHYVQSKHYEQASALISQATFPQAASNNEWARHLYYLGRIAVVRLDYSAAERHFAQAMRKAPQHAGVGFKQIVNKMLIVVNLLLGDIPDRTLFKERTMLKALNPYFQLTRAVRTGNLQNFQAVLDKHGASFHKDETYHLIVRLRHNVIKTGVRKMASSYSRISLADVASKLQLDSPEDAEFIVAKAIRDGVIRAAINHEKGFVQCDESIDIYSTSEPCNAFHTRITFCLETHKSSVQAMRYPSKANGLGEDGLTPGGDFDLGAFEDEDGMDLDDYDAF